MQVSKQSIYQFLEGSNKTFVIPVYQRDYSWKRENCKKLWEDMMEMHEKEREHHFLGTFVNIYDKNDERLIVDGQQRLTTITLFLIALERSLKRKADKKPEESLLQDQLLEFLINKYSLDKAKRIRLKPNKQDQHYFNQLFEDSEEMYTDSNIVSNFLYFSERIEESPLSPGELFDVFRKLEIVNIELERHHDDPQLIFESLNSTGVDLTDGDLIRNYILMDLEPAVQEKLYGEYWTKIEDMAGDTAEFVRNLLMFKLQRNVTQSKRAVYSEFKDFAEEVFDGDSEAVLELLRSYAKIYGYFVRSKEHKNSAIEHRLQRLYQFEFKVAYPFLFEVFDLLEKEILDASTVEKIIGLIESFAVRRVLVHRTTQGLNKLFLTLSKEIKRLASDEWQDHYYEILKFVLKNKAGGQKFPTDEEFIETLASMEVYTLRSKNRDFLLESLENYDSAFSVDISDMTIEHIMPQTLTAEWKSALGEQWKDVHSRLLHTIGNLTLVAENSKLSNKDFQAKQKIELHQSKLKLCYTLGDHEQWNEQAILQRGHALAAEAAEIWQYPTSTFETPVEESRVYQLSEDLELTNTKPSAMYIGEEKFPIKHWNEVRILLVKKFYKESPTECRQLMQHSELARYFSTEKKTSSYYEFVPGYFVELHGSTYDMLRFVIKLYEYFGEDYSEVSFEV